ncbi:GDNF family receptor alpha-4 isoform X1 [Cavia porcellus]|uniref:GDNF family receptor alpha-4 isoform X1 n=1 Tax=Cavia porcellus TaxID=10141 RepID=UPI002FE2B20C
MKPGEGTKWRGPECHNRCNCCQVSSRGAREWAQTPGNTCPCSGGAGKGTPAHRGFASSNPWVLVLGGSRSCPAWQAAWDPCCCCCCCYWGLRATPEGTAASTRPRRARRTRGASGYAPSTWRAAWRGLRPGAVPAPAATAPCAASSPADRPRSPTRCSSARAQAPRVPSAGARPSSPPAPSTGRAPCGPPAWSPWTPACRAGPRLLAFQASCAPVPSTPDGCQRDQGLRCLRAYAGLVGTAVTPNYVDNASARVAPWCDCRASGNRREECEAFRGLFTRNQCLDGAIGTFDSRWSGLLQVQLDPHQDPGYNLLQVSSAAGPLKESSLLSIFPVLALRPLL